MAEPDNPPGLDLRALRQYLEREHPELVAGPLSGEVVEGGRSNLTYLVDDGTQRWVIRRPPLGHVLPTAHDMRREYTVISALAGTAVPVPATLSHCTDTEVLGAPFYIMEYVPGTPFRTANQLRPLGAERTHTLGLSLVDTLVDLHAVDPHAVGLGDFGKPAGFLQRQLRRWKKQLEGSRNRDVPGIDELHDVLETRLPESPSPTVVHGDYRLDNVLVNDTDTITAVLDWEMSTLGDPLTDLGMLVAYAERDTFTADVVSDAGAAPGYPDTDEVIARYSARSGRDVSDLGWYIAFAFFKLAVILEGIHYRYSQGQTVGEGFDKIGDAVFGIVDRGNSALGKG